MLLNPNLCLEQISNISITDLLCAYMYQLLDAKKIWKNYLINFKK